MRLAVALLALSLVGCPDRNIDVLLRPGERLVDVAWRGSTLWLLTRTARVGEGSETYVFRELSRLGWFEESATIRER